MCVIGVFNCAIVIISSFRLFVCVNFLLSALNTYDSRLSAAFDIAHSNEILVGLILD